MNGDIDNTQDIKILVDRFYERVGKDPLLSPIFSRISANDHIKQTLYAYWTSILLNTPADNPHQFPKHIEQMLNRRHFVRWMNLFLETIDDLYAGATTEKAKVMVIRKSEEFQSRLNLSRF